MTILDAKIPQGNLADKWTRYKSEIPLVSPSNKKKLEVIVVGTGIAGSSAAASLAELGYNVSCFTFHDSSRRAHSVAAQGGINAAKNYQNDNDSVYRLFYDMMKGGDFRSREANVYRAAEVSNQVIDQLTAQGVPFAREYGGTLANRSFGGVQVSRTFYAKGQTGQQCLLGANAALNRQINLGKIHLHTGEELLDMVVVEGKTKGIITRDIETGKLHRYAAHAVVLATGGYGTIYYLSTLSVHSNVTATWRAYKKGAFFANPSFVQIHPTCIPVMNEFQSKLTLMSESLRNDGRVWVPKKAKDTRLSSDIPEEERDYFLERLYPSYGNLVPRDVATRATKQRCDAGYGVGETGLAVYLDFSQAIKKQGITFIEEKYGNLFEMYQKITGINPYKEPMRIYPAGHYSMGGLWVDYNLMTTLPGLFAIGEANFSDHGANRLGASSLMQCAADGYFILPATIGAYLSKEINTPLLATTHPAFGDAEEQVSQAIQQLIQIQGTKTATYFHKSLGDIMWHYCGMSRTKEGLTLALDKISLLESHFYQDVKIPTEHQGYNQELSKALRLVDFFGLAKLMCRDALEREESCGAHFREEYQTNDGEAVRDDARFAHVAAWGYNGEKLSPIRHVEILHFEEITPNTRNYI